MLKAYIQNKQNVQVIRANAVQVFMKVVFTRYSRLANASHLLRMMYATTNLYSPYGLLQRMKKLETKAIFF